MTPPPAAPVLTRARRAVWDAIEHWPELRGVFRRTWKFEDDGPMPLEPEPTIGDLPALALFPSASAGSDWVASQSQLFPYTLDARMWTRHWALPAGERLWEEIAKALYQSAPPGGPSYLFQGTGRSDASLGPVSVTRASLGERGPAAALWRWSIGLKIQWNPAAF